MRHIGLLIFVLSSNVYAQEVYHADRTDQGLCKNIHNSLECARTIEKAVLPLLSVATRSENKLLLHRAGKKHEFEDSSGTFYSLRGLLLGSHFVLEIQEYESVKFLIIDSITWQSTQVMGPPVPSPDQKWSFTSNPTDGRGFDTGGLELYKTTTFPNIVAFSYNGPCSVIRPHWVSNSTIEFRCLLRSHESNQELPTKYIRLQEGAWYTVDIP